MNKMLRVPRRLIPVLLFLLSSPLWADVCKVLILSPENLFPMAEAGAQLEAMLVAGDQFAEVDVSHRTLTANVTFSTSLFGAAYVPPYRSDFQAEIQQGGWTHVVMVDRPLLYAIAPELHYVGVNAMAKVISAAGAQPVLMMPWVDRATINGLATNNTLVREYAYRVGDGVRDSLGRTVPVIPTGAVWNSLSATNRGTLPTQPTGGVAMNGNAKYAVAASLYHYLTGGNAKATSVLPFGLSEATRDAIADHAVSVAASEAVSVRYTGEFQSARVRFWADPEKVAFSSNGTSTENAIEDQLESICRDDGKPYVDTAGVWVSNMKPGQTPANLVFTRDSYTSPVSTYDAGSPVTTMVAGFDRQADDVNTGLEGAAYAEMFTISLYVQSITNGWTYLPYHLLWVRTMYDLNIPIDNFSVHAPDWQFAATASALYTLRTGGRNGIHPAKAGYVYWSPKLRTERFAWQTGQMAWRTMHEMATLKPAPPAPDRPFGFNRVIDAESYFASSRSPSIEQNAVETYQVVGLQDGDWLSYKVDFGATPPAAISCLMNVAATTGNATIEVRDGSPSGPLLGSVDMTATGSASTFQEFRGLLLPVGVTGIRELHFVIRSPLGGTLAVESFRLSELARGNESAWVQPAGGAWEDSANWSPNIPNAPGQTARFSLDIPGGLPENTPVTVSGTPVLSALQLGHGVGTTGGIRLLAHGNGTLKFENPAGMGLIRKEAGGDDEIATPVLSDVALEIKNETYSLLTISAPISGQRDLFPCGNVDFSGSGYDLGRVGYSTGSTSPGNVNTAHLGGTFNWTANGTFRNLYIPLHTVWTLRGGDLTNLGWTEIGNNDGGSGGSSTLTIEAGIFRHASTEFLRLGHFYKAATFLNLNGGVFETQTGFTKSAGNATVTFNGGLLRYSGAGDVADLFARGANPRVVTRVGSGGARFDIAANRTVTLSDALVPVGASDGGLEKWGGGTLILSGNNTFAGPIVVREGVLHGSSDLPFGAAKHFTVQAGAAIVGGISLAGPGSGWFGAGRVEGDLVVSSSTMDLTEGPMTVTQSVFLQNAVLEMIPTPGQARIQSHGPVELVGALSVASLAPQDAIPAGAFVPVIEGASREGEFSSVMVHELWTPTYTATSMGLTALANIPGVRLSPPNDGVAASWGSSIVLSASASDVVGISKVEFFANGEKIGDGARDAGNFTFQWSLDGVEAGTYAISVRVTNQEGIVQMSAAQNLTVVGLGGDVARWDSASGGAWSTASNWVSERIADSYAPAYFDSFDLPVGNTTVTVDAPRTVSKLVVSDLGSGTPGTLKFDGSSALTLSGGGAEVNVGNATTVDGSAPLVAPLGFRKSGLGTLRLSGPNVGLAGRTRASEGVLAINHPQALGASTLTLTGGNVSFSSQMTHNAPWRVETTKATTVDFAVPVTLTGPWTNSGNGTSLLLLAGSATANLTLSNSIQLPGMDLHVAGYNSSVEFTGNVSVRDFLFYGRSTPSNMSLKVTFSGNATATCSGKLGTANNSGTTNIWIQDQASLTMPDHTSTQRSSFYLYGGMLTARRLIIGTLSSMNFSGGTLRAMASDPQFVSFAGTSTRNIIIYQNPMIVDSNGYDVGLTPNVATGANPDGGLIKKGAGTMSLTANMVGMAWRGPTRVEAGTLKFGSLSGLSPNTKVFSIASGAALDIATSATPTLTISSATHAISGSGTIKGNLAMSAGNATLTAGQPLTVTGSASLGGNLSILGSLSTPGDHVLLQAASISGTFANAPVLPEAPPGFTRTLVYEANRVLIRVSGSGDLWLASEAGPEAEFSDDPDGDGWTYLEEYALGLETSGALPPRLEIPPGQDPGFRFGVRVAAGDVTMEVQSSHDLIHWTTLFTKPAGSSTSWTSHAAGASLQQGPIEAGIQEITVTAPPSAETKDFFRVQVRRLEAN